MSVGEINHGKSEPVNTLLKKISDVVPTLDGWCSVQKAHVLASSIVALRPKSIVEIGVWGGRSLIPMALACKFLNNGIVVGIDPWKAEESIKGQNEANVNWWGKVVNHDVIFKRCNDEIQKAGVSRYCDLVRTTSDDYPVSVIAIDMLHIDGNHGEQAYKDTRKFAPHLTVGGLIFMDDIGWDGGHVGKSCEWLTSNGFRKLYNLDTGAMFQRIA